MGIRISVQEGGRRRKGNEIPIFPSLLPAGRQMPLSYSSKILCTLA
jgi:hypothetical protein